MNKQFAESVMKQKHMHIYVPKLTFLNLTKYHGEPIEIQFKIQQVMMILIVDGPPASMCNADGHVGNQSGYNCVLFHWAVKFKKLSFVFS